VERLALPRRRALTRLLIAVLLLVPLVPAQAASSKRVVVTGELHYADGTPAAGQHVELERVTGFGDALATLFFFGFTGGLASLFCFQEEASDALVACGKNSAATRTDRNGRYRFEMSADAIDTPDRSFRISARVTRTAKRAAGARVEVRTHLRPGTNKLPLLPFWEPKITGPLDNLSWTPVPGDPTAGYGVEFTGRNGFTLDSSADPLDLRMLEDTRGTLSVTARGHRGQLGATWTSPLRSYRGTAGAPVSRNARCTATVERRAGAVSQAPCWLTDARFGTKYQGPRPRHCFKDPAFDDEFFHVPPSCEFASVRIVEIDLMRVVPVDAVVLRGECDDCVVISSPDHAHWDKPLYGAAVGTVMDWKGVEARWVRVLPPSDSFRSRLAYEVPGAKVGGRDLPDDAPGDVSGLTELSVWAAGEAPPVDVPPVDDTPAPQAVRPPADSDDEGVSTSAVVLAVLLLLAVSGAVVTTAMSRS
jgi:hypothetical protein